jgi:hypothetical protein
MAVTVQDIQREAGLRVRKVDKNPALRYMFGVRKAGSRDPYKIHGSKELTRLEAEIARLLVLRSASREVECRIFQTTRYKRKHTTN